MYFSGEQHQQTSLLSNAVTEFLAIVQLYLGLQSLLRGPQAFLGQLNALYSTTSSRNINKP